MWLWLLTIPVGGFVAWRALTKPKNNASHVIAGPPPAAPANAPAPAPQAAPPAVMTPQGTYSHPDAEVSDGYSSADATASSGSGSAVSSGSGATDKSKSAAVMPVAATVTANPPPLAPKLTTANPTLATIAKATAILPQAPVPPPIVGLPTVSAVKSVVMPPPIVQAPHSVSPPILQVSTLQTMVNAVPLNRDGSLQLSPAMASQTNDIVKYMRANPSTMAKAPAAVKARLVGLGISPARLY